MSTKHAMSTIRAVDASRTPVGLWLDPVCPFGWNTARWVMNVSQETGFDIEWHLMSLAELNEGRELSLPQQARMIDSRHIGRLMAAIEIELGNEVLPLAYITFGEEYFGRGVIADERLAAHVLRTVGARTTSCHVMSDEDLDAVVRRSHQASQQALGDTGGSPLLTVYGRTFFGPVLTSVPEGDDGRAVFDAVTTLATTPEFSQLQRPRAHP